MLSKLDFELIDFAKHLHKISMSRGSTFHSWTGQALGDLAGLGGPCGRLGIGACCQVEVGSGAGGGDLLLGMGLGVREQCNHRNEQHFETRA